MIRNQFQPTDVVWLSDDREALDYARRQGMPVRQTQHVVAETVQPGLIPVMDAWAMLEQMREQGRLGVQIPDSPSDLNYL